MTDSTPDLSVYGGRGGTRANLEDLHRATGALRSAARELEEAASRCLQAEWRLEAHTGFVSRASGDVDEVRARARAEEALESARRGPAAPGAAATQIDDLASALDRAAQVYRDADACAEGRAGALARAVGAGNGWLSLGVVGVLGGGVVVAAAGALALGPSVLTRMSDVSGRSEREIAARALEQAGVLAEAELAEHATQIELLLAGVGSGLASLVIGRRAASVAPVPLAAGVVTGVLDLNPAWRRRPLTVVPSVEVEHPAPPQDLGDVARRLAALYPASGGREGTIGVERLDQPDGTRSWVVEIPGTQELGFGSGDDPMDMATNVRAMAGAPDDVSELVTEALRQSGAAADEPVLLVGHSQGGMVAMSLAASAVFTATHRVAAVATFGSPVGAVSVPRDIQVLNIEHEEDIMPTLDGTPSPDQSNRTTVRRDLRDSPDPLDRLAGRTTGDAHALDTYQRTVDAVDAVSGPSLEAWREAASEVFGDGGASVTAREFTGVRGKP